MFLKNKHDDNERHTTIVGPKPECSVPHILPHQPFLNFPSYISPQSSVDLHFHNLQPDTSLHCETTDIVHHIAVADKISCLLPSFCCAHFLPRCMECRRGLAMGILSVRLSVCLSVRQTRGLWQNKRKLYLDFYIIRKNIYPSFLRRRMVGEGQPFYLKFWVHRPALGRNRRFWIDNRS